MNAVTRDTAPLSEDAIVELTLEALVSDGRALGRVDGMVLLVADGLPGQTVRVRVTAVRRRLAEGVIEAVLAPSPQQRPAHCPHADCGGCPWQTLQPEAQQHWKERLVADALTRIGHLPEPLPLLPLLASPEAWGYRNKMEFAFGRDAQGNPALGLRERRSRHIVPVTECRLQSPQAMEVLGWLRAAIQPLMEDAGLPVWDSEQRAGFWRYVVIRQATTGTCLVELIVAPHPEGIEAMVGVGKHLADGLREALPAVAGVALSERAAWDDVACGEKIRYTRGLTQLAEPVGDVPCVLAPQAFMQVNTQAAALLYAEAAQLLRLSGTETVWDLYCGTGAIAMALAPHAGTVHGVEIAPRAVTLARELASQAGLHNCVFHIGDVGTPLRRLPRPDVVVVDPPRAGLHEQALRAVMKSGAERVLYISCNPATFARDAALLNTTYKLTAVRPVDIFPQTPHVEVAGLFARR